jgi:hypothetical protein
MRNRFNLATPRSELDEMTRESRPVIPRIEGALERPAVAVAIVAVAGVVVLAAAVVWGAAEAAVGAGAAGLAYHLLTRRRGAANQGDR